MSSPRSSTTASLTTCSTSGAALRGVWLVDGAAGRAARAPPACGAVDDRISEVVWPSQIRATLAQQDPILSQLQRDNGHRRSCGLRVTLRGTKTSRNTVPITTGVIFEMALSKPWKAMWIAAVVGSTSLLIGLDGHDSRRGLRIQQQLVRASLGADARSKQVTLTAKAKRVVDRLAVQWRAREVTIAAIEAGMRRCSVRITRRLHRQEVPRKGDPRMARPSCRCSTAWRRSGWYPWRSTTCSGLTSRLAASSSTRRGVAADRWRC